MSKSSSNVLGRHKRANYEYQIEETFEAGISLLGTEVKALRAGKVNLIDGWVRISPEGEAFLQQVHIGHYSHGNIYNHAEVRPRKLLLRKSQIETLKISVESEGYSIVPLKIYLKGSLIKVLIGLGKGKKLHDKRRTIRERETKREMDRAIRDTSRGRD